MDPKELVRLMTIIRGHIDSGKVKAARTREQIADTDARGVSSLWNLVAGSPPRTIDFDKVDPKDTPIVFCIPITLGEQLDPPDNRTGSCQWGCGRMIMWRPYLPDSVPKVCLYCAVDRIERGNQ